MSMNYIQSILFNPLNNTLAFLNDTVRQICKPSKNKKLTSHELREMGGGGQDATDYKESPANKPVLSQRFYSAVWRRKTFLDDCMLEWLTDKTESQPHCSCRLTICWWQHVCLARHCPAFLGGPIAIQHTHMFNLNKTQSKQSSPSVVLLSSPHTFLELTHTHTHTWVVSGISL